MPAYKISLNRVNSQEVCYKSWWLEVCKEHTAVLLPWTEEIQLRFTGHRAEKCRLPPKERKKKRIKFVLQKKIQGWERRKRILSLKMTKLQNGSAHASPKGQAARQTMQESPCRIPTTFSFFFSPLASISATATFSRRIQQTKGNTIHHWGSPV